ncbi:hypothetical protein K431DRAFT_48111 [Polychaeton citri CBS 116435]|uniref:Uncharacterized protein n=1 Tax=Polychaeton citri CBS 116435 TaxID=1314669 RepID=A0A9P4UV20_9PEZI|nr:hypothetical protein K431DRAFT_48111 [Polychaeton citri CBS 116435]
MHNRSVIAATATAAAVACYHHDTVCLDVVAVQYERGRARSYCTVTSLGGTGGNGQRAWAEKAAHGGLALVLSGWKGSSCLAKQKGEVSTVGLL